jgi:hypothetical protein
MMLASTDDRHTVSIPHSSTHVDSWAESGPLMENLALRGSLPDEANGTALVEER